MSYPIISNATVVSGTTLQYPIFGIPNLSGPISGYPPSAFTGLVVYNTGTMYYSDGTNWIPISIQGSATVTTASPVVVLAHTLPFTYKVLGNLKDQNNVDVSFTAYMIDGTSFSVASALNPTDIGTLTFYLIKV